jgi:hypothetical protein
MNPPPLPTKRRVDLPADMACHVTTPNRRFLAVAAFCALTFAQLHLYTDALAPVVLGDAVFVLDADGPRLEDAHDHDAWISADSLLELLFSVTPFAERVDCSRFDTPNPPVVVEF